MIDKPNRYETELIELYRQAESDIIAIIAEKKQAGYVVHGEQGALERIRRVLRELTGQALPLVPSLAETAFLNGMAKSIRSATARELIGASGNRRIVDLLTRNLTGELTDAAQVVGRMINDTWRKSALEAVAQKEAGGYGASMAATIFREKLVNEGLTAFTAENGAEWSLASYASMATRALTREATNSGTLFADPEHDLYMISSHASSCPICAPLEGRIYSRSGLDADFPALTMAFFSRKDKSGPDTLDNSHLNIHPNCRHVLIRVDEDNFSPAEWDRLKEFSNRDWEDDPRSKASIENYRKSQEVRRKLREDFDQFQRYKLRLGDDMPKTFQTFQRVKAENPERFAGWMEKYRAAGAEFRDMTGGE